MDVSRAVPCQCFFCNVLTLAWFQLQDRGTTISDSRIQALSDFSPHLRKEEDRQSLVSALQAPSAQVHTGGYADDLHLIYRLVMQVFRGHVLTLLWAEARGMKLNAKKTLAFGAVKLHVGEVELAVVPKCKILGHMLHRDVQLAETPTNRVKEVQRRLQRVEAVRAGRSVSRVEAIEALLTICAPGHRVDPVQYLPYRTVKSWIRWLRQPQIDQDSARLQRSWHRMHDFAYPAGTSGRGMIAPPLTDPTSVVGFPGQHWLEVDCTIQFACRWHSVRSS